MTVDSKCRILELGGSGNWELDAVAVGSGGCGVGILGWIGAASGTIVQL